MIAERRQDIGVKVGFFVLTAVIAGMLSIFFWGTYTRADIACAKSEIALKGVAVVEESVRGIYTTLTRMDAKLERIDNRLNGK